jgi:DNA-binding Xre family transcriptional regulator
MKTKSFRVLRDKLMAEPERAAGLDAARERVAQEEADYRRSLAELRQARALTQADLAKMLSVSQAQVSRIENQADLYLSTLQNYVRALGGSLELVGVFGPSRVVLSLSELSESGTDGAAV